MSLLYVSLHVSDTDEIHGDISDVLFFDVIGIIYITVNTIRHVTNTSGVTQELDCVTVVFPESLSLFVMSSDGVCLYTRLCNCHMSSGLLLGNYPFYFYQVPH